MKYKETHCLEILNNIVKNKSGTDLILVSAHYNVDSLTAIVKDSYNEQEYELILKPIGGAQI